MGGNGAGRGFDHEKILELNGEGENGSPKSIPSCCKKAIAAMPESEAKCHATVVSGWFSESRLYSGH